ncbi:tyrosinase family oxidase copper chaperone [Streptomyces sp. NPDC003697]
MVVSIAGAPARTGNAATEPARRGPKGLTRRNATGGLAACALAAVLAPVAAVPQSSRPRSAAGDAPDRTGFDEVHEGRRIRGVWIPAGGAAEDGRWDVTVDGRPLHLMRRADGTWLSMVDHYESYRTPLEAARAAVDELGPGRRLRVPALGPAGAAHSRTGHRHGVRA